MANTFKVKTNAAMPSSAGTALTLYTVPSSTTTVVVGLTLCNVHTSAVTATVKIESDTSDTETNENVTVVKDASIPAGSSLIFYLVENMFCKLQMLLRLIVLFRLKLMQLCQSWR